MNEKKGWISLHRKITDHWLYQEKRVFSKFEAWIDILLEVNHAEAKLLIQNTLFVIKKGQSINSLETWSKRWNWNKSMTRRFLKTLEQDEMVKLRNEYKTTRLTVCKFEDYQDKRNADETELKRNRNASETQATPNNNDNKNNNDNNDNNKSIKERKSDFYKVLSPYSISYSVKMVNDFFEYWSEHGDKDKKMRFEKEKSWSLEARLKRWSEKSWNKSEVNSSDDGRHKTGLYNVI